ncbi:cyclic nucleotide-binding domain-containing protein [Paenibacillus sp. BR1-192]|uniref:Crp/Fnr family transcriptional regulator n=1 Tax=Paenibacillus sp. BR1-192 TaxID=3032287 RepID=UPI00240D7C92|nr:cyclic nucleotide-binding domain-containing protein [Paenibacillus sp. BR1-192]WFB58462.1 cyclic nucleotide-binding domain-containing protein [Paenibacillus sp. BR1-192]
MKRLHDATLLKAKMEQFQFGNMLDLGKSAPFTLQQYEPGEIILHEGCAMQSLLFLVQGKIKVTSSIETGKSLLLRFGHPFSIIGDIELIRDVPVQSQIEAVNECLFIGLSFDYIRLHEMTNARFTATLLDHLSYKLQTCTTASRVNLLASVENRFASYLMSTMSPGSDPSFGMELKTDHIGEIASLLGTTHRHLNRVMFAFAQRGILERNGQTIRILDWNAMETASNGIRYE